MELQALSDRDLDEWRNHPVSVLVRLGVKASIKAQSDMAMQAYWAGQPWPEQDRLALIRAEAHLDDMFESNADDFKQMMEMFNDQPERADTP